MARDWDVRWEPALGPDKREKACAAPLWESQIWGVPKIRALGMEPKIKGPLLSGQPREMAPQFIETAILVSKRKESRGVGTEMRVMGARRWVS